MSFVWRLLSRITCAFMRVMDALSDCRAIGGGGWQVIASGAFLYGISTSVGVSRWQVIASGQIVLYLGMTHPQHPGNLALAGLWLQACDLRGDLLALFGADRGPLSLALLHDLQQQPHHLGHRQPRVNGSPAVDQHRVELPRRLFHRGVDQHLHWT